LGNVLDVSDGGDTINVGTDVVKNGGVKRVNVRVGVQGGLGGKHTPVNIVAIIRTAKCLPLTAADPRPLTVSLPR